MRELTVYLNRDGLNTVDTDMQAVRATGSLSLVLENHGKPTHVHFHPDDELAALGTITEPHVFVPNGERRQVQMEFGTGTGAGQLEITAGYGQERAVLNVTVDRPTPETDDEDTTAQATTTDGAGAQPATGPSALIEDTLDIDRLRNPVVIGSLGAVALLFFLLLFISPIAALSSVVIGLLVGVAVVGYLSDWDPRDTDRQ